METGSIQETWKEAHRDLQLPMVRRHTNFRLETSARRIPCRVQRDSHEGDSRQDTESDVTEDPMNELTLSFISKGKTNGLTPADIQTRLGQKNWSRKRRAFAKMMIRVWQEYESRLKDNDILDFSDMINLALGVAKSGMENWGYTSTFWLRVPKHHGSTTGVNQAPAERRGDGTLFCVGDDMQNIFSFAGSNVENILRFGETFPYPSRPFLLRTTGAQRTSSRLLTWSPA